MFCIRCLVGMGITFNGGVLNLFCIFFFRKMLHISTWHFQFPLFVLVSGVFNVCVVIRERLHEAYSGEHICNSRIRFGTMFLMCVLL